MDILLLMLWIYMVGCCIALACIKWINDQPQEGDAVILFPLGFSYFSWLIVGFFAFVFIKKFIQNL